MDPTIPPNHVSDYEPEPTEELTFVPRSRAVGSSTQIPTWPVLSTANTADNGRVLVPGKPKNRAYRRAEASEARRAKPDPRLQSTRKPATDATPTSQE